MARVVRNKSLENTRLATNYGGWMYCDQCNENIGYLCYATYDCIDLKYICNCGSKGQVQIDFVDSKTGVSCCDEMLLRKNRLCCSKNEEPLITLLDKKLEHYEVNITCKSCGNIYKKIK